MITAAAPPNSFGRASLKLVESSANCATASRRSNTRPSDWTRATSLSRSLLSERTSA
jgi:hypothetical protein